MMDDTCAKFGDFSFSRFGFIVRTQHTVNLLINAGSPLNAGGICHKCTN